MVDKRRTSEHLKSMNWYCVICHEDFQKEVKLRLHKCKGVRRDDTK